MGSNGICVNEVWNIFKDILREGIKRFVSHKTLRKNSDPECYMR
jgi:hypothetical protein